MASDEALVAARVRLRYVQWRRDRGDLAFGVTVIPQWDGGLDRQRRRHAPIWPRIAELCLEAALPPSAHVMAAFLAAELEPPWPPMLLGDAALTRTRRFLDRTPEAVAWERTRDLQVLAREVAWRRRQGSEADAIRRALVSPEAGFSLTGRYLLAARAGLDELAAMLYPRALVRYAARFGAYDEIWGSLWTADLHVAAEVDDEHRTRTAPLDRARTAHAVRGDDAP